jgi:hypothetical protein
MRKTCLAILLLSALAFAARPAKADPNLASLTPNARQIFLDSMHWGDHYFDSHTDFLLSPSPQAKSVPSGKRHYTVRASGWYALGLLLRNGKGDQDRAIHILNAMLAMQYDEPGKPWDGTFRRTPDEPEPPANAVMWHDFDPNWREFIGTTFVMVLEEFPDRIPDRLARRMDQSIVRAVAGEIHEHRLVPTYTNPALMFGFLWNYAAVRNHRADWIAQSTAWQQNLYHLYEQHHAFAEFNSPTYCGVDLYALGLWRKYGSTPRIREMGQEMEAGLWRNLATFYNADLRNLSGPFDRSYGMDMTNYVSVVGVALSAALGPGLAPLPPLQLPITHMGDLWYAPEFAILDVHIPADAMQAFRGFQGERRVRKQITDQRIATAWIGRHLMYGGEITGKTKGILGHSQFHAATVQWRTPAGAIGWIQLIQAPPLDAVAGPHGLKLSCSGSVRFRIHAPGIHAADLKRSEWVLPGLVIHTDSDSRSFAADQEPGAIEVEYHGITQLTLTFRLRPTH